MTQLFKESIDVFKRLTVDRLKNAFSKYENQKADSHTYGRVVSVNSDGSYMVQLNASSTLTRCANCCTAMAGDRVLVLIKTDGKCVVAGRVGGNLGGGGGAGVDWVEDFGEDGIWTWVKYASGIAECWLTETITIKSWYAWGSGYLSNSATRLQDKAYPFEFLELPSVNASVTNTNSNWEAGVVLYGGSTTRSPVVDAFRSSAGNTEAMDYAFMLHVKGLWKELERPEGGGSGGGAVTYSQGDVSDWIAGKVFPYAGTNEPIGSLLCDGRAVSRREYWELFDAIGTTYGAGDGSSTFNLPNIESRTIIGEGTGESGTEYSLGDIGGEEEHKLIIEEMPKHGHPEPRTVWNAASGQIDGYVMIGDYTQTTTQSIGSQGGDQPHNNMQPYIVMRYFITTGKGDPVSGINPADYVVEWGNDNGWRWEKWASGKAECWGKFATKTVEPSAWGSLYEIAKLTSQPYPFEFVEVPIEDATARMYAYYISSVETNPKNLRTKTESGVYVATRPTTCPAGYDIEFELHVVGKWKDSPASGGTETIAPTIEERFKELEARLAEAEYDSGWMNLYYIKDKIEMFYRKKNGYITVTGLSAGYYEIGGSKYHDVTTLPEGFRPTKRIDFTMHFQGGGALNHAGYIDTDGRVRMWCSASSCTYWAFSVTFPVD